MKKVIEDDIEALAKLKARLCPEIKIEVPKEVLEDVCAYCEYMGIYDKLSEFGDFYYKIKKLISNEKEK